MSPKPLHALTLKSNGGLTNVLISEVLVTSPGAYPPTRKYKGLWDTGATNTVITQRVINELKLFPIGITNVNTASEKNHRTTQYIVDVFLKIDLVIQNVVVTLGNLSNIDLLIGMDIIGTGDFSITNHNKVTCMSFRFPSCHEIDYVKNLNFMAPPDHKIKIPPAPPLNGPCPCGSGKLYKRCHGKP